jgi:K+-transporting ATPase ATPase C chain
MKEIKNAILFLGLFTILFGFLYPFTITMISQVVFPVEANGSLLMMNEKVVGSRLIGQRFTSPQYFHGRPSAIDYVASISGGTNFGPTNERFLKRVRETIEQLRRENELSPKVKIPSDMVLASASGLDPYISVEAALLQVPRIARVRGLDESTLRGLIEKHQKKILFENAYIVNVLELNMALDGMGVNVNGIQET